MAVTLFWMELSITNEQKKTCNIVIYFPRNVNYDIYIDGSHQRMIRLNTGDMRHSHLHMDESYIYKIPIARMIIV